MDALLPLYVAVAVIVAAPFATVWIVPPLTETTSGRSLE